jgi:cellulose synthase/poly-beta-1,6-N-acetylglucosamine synthase-like glycosyltransferase
MMEKMARKQILAFLVLGVCLTLLVSFFPVLADRYATNSVSLSTLYDEKELVQFLSKQQAQSHVFLGVHGYVHVCPLCGSTTHELCCPNGEISYAEIDRRITEGLEIFKKCGLRADFYAFPGEEYDSRCIDILKAKGFYIVPYIMGGETREMPADYSMLNFTFNNYLTEYTWNWRFGVSADTINKTLQEIDKDKPVTLLMHIQDYNNQTRSILEYAVQHGTTIIRCDDITSNWDLSNVKALTEFTTIHHVSLLLAIIPAFKAIPSSPLSAYISVTWYLFLGSFVFPVAVTVPWALYFKVKRKIKPLSGNPHFPSVSLILPAYNEEKTIGRSIEHGLNQDYQGNIEIIVVNDGSTDKTEEIVRRYCNTLTSAQSEDHNASPTKQIATDDEANVSYRQRLIALFSRHRRRKQPNVKLISHVHNKGKPAALNTGFANSTGEISIFQDTDSVIASNLVSKMVAHFQDPKVGLVAGMIVIDNEHNLLTRLQQIEYLYSQTIIRFCQASHQNVLVCPGAATAVRTSIARKIPSTDRTITEDADFTFAVWKDGWKVTQEPEALSYTEAPDEWSPFIDQRKRWLYGVLQTITLHKWALHTKNLWVIWAWLGYMLCPLSVLSLMMIPVFYFILGTSFLWFLIIYSGLTLSIFMSAQVIGVLLFAGERKTKLLVLLPVYVLYQTLLQLLLVYLVFAYVTKRGIHIRYGGKSIHAVR